MLHSRVHIEAGDMVIMYFTRDNMMAITVTPGEHFHNKYGRFAHDDMIGMKFGSKMHAPPPYSGWIYLLRPTPELWTLSLPHRTQILYMTDIAFIIQRLGVRPGSTVIEAGTGSGSMTHSLSRAVGPRGKVRSFEYHEPRYHAAKQEFIDHKLGNVQVEHQNVCKNGFNDASNVQGVFLDLPAPWEAIPHAIKTFRDDVIVRMCCFSPCLEQVLKTVSTLREHGFEDITTQEVLIRTHEIVQPPAANTEPPYRSITSIVDKLRDHETRKQERRIIQMKTAREKARQKKEAQEGQTRSSAAVEADHEREEGSAQIDSASGTAAAGSPNAGEKRKHEVVAEAGPSTSPKRTKTDTDLSIEISTTTEETVKDDADTLEPSKVASKLWTEPETNLRNVVVTKPSAEMRGHTSYLTFAAYYPKSIRVQVETPEASVQPSTAAGKRLEQIASEARAERAGSQDTDYGSEGIDEVMGTLTEEEMMGLAAFIPPCSPPPPCTPFPPLPSPSYTLFPAPLPTCAGGRGRQPSDSKHRPVINTFFIVDILSTKHRHRLDQPYFVHLTSPVAFLQTQRYEDSPSCIEESSLVPLSAFRRTERVSSGLDEERSKTKQQHIHSFPPWSFSISISSCSHSFLRNDNELLSDTRSPASESTSTRFKAAFNPNHPPRY